MSTTLITTGGLGIFGDFAARTIAEARVIELLRKVLNATIHGPFRALFDQTTRAPFQRHDVRIDVTLTTAGEANEDMIIALVRSELRTNAPLGERLFLCSPKRYPRDYYHRHGFTEHWTIDPARGIAADDPDTFTVLDYSINGVSQDIQRSASKGEQIYTVTPRDVTASPGELYHEEYTYRVLMPRHGQSLYFTVDVPTRNFSLKVNHFDTGISRLTLVDFFASETEPRINASSATLPAPPSVSVDGWIMPTSGVVITWNLNTPALAKN
ncbi:hypothetical protein [Amycolatopsis sp. H20-H5]|uniref:hypothetical protein n=1 Tax=Amycolatopsis sp. H20-H5 TaxID=3046309 RepID=UPI002DB59E50|nr:hypothetical protein [Amycolatopsis sp. H20-H5]MEC3974872.1 hypothetical protein [Amycolatopsis sp. H20-H5]